MLDIIIIYINYFSKDVLIDSIQSLYRSIDGLDKNIDIVVCNNSPQEPISDIQELFPDIRIIENEKNLGFGRAINRVLCNMDTEYAIFLNPDTVLSENFVITLYTFLKENKDYAIAYSLIKNTDGTVQPASLRNTPRILPSVFRLLGLSKIFRNIRYLSSYNRGYEGYHTEQDVDTVSGSCMMIRKSVFDEIGGFDERYFLYGEDLDIAREVRLRGHRIRFIPSCHVIHIKNYSSRDKWFMPLFYFHYSMLLYLAKYSKGIFKYLNIVFGFFFIGFLFILKVFYGLLRILIKRIIC